MSRGRRRSEAHVSVANETPIATAEGSGTSLDRWVPDCGDVIWLEFDSQAGREQAGRRPAIVLSPAVYNAPTSRALCVPVSSKAKGYPFEVALPDGLPVQGVAFADQVTWLDWRARHARFVAALPARVVDALLARARALAGVSGGEDHPTRKPVTSERLPSAFSHSEHPQARQSLGRVYLRA